MLNKCQLLLLLSRLSVIHYYGLPLGMSSSFSLQQPCPEGITMILFIDKEKEAKKVKRFWKIPRQVWPQSLCFSPPRMLPTIEGRVHIFSSFRRALAHTPATALLSGRAGMIGRSLAPTSGLCHSSPQPPTKAENGISTTVLWRECFLGCAPGPHTEIVPFPQRSTTGYICYLE